MRLPINRGIPIVYTDPATFSQDGDASVVYNVTMYAFYAAATTSVTPSVNSLDFPAILITENQPQKVVDAVPLIGSTLGIAPAAGKDALLFGYIETGSEVCMIPTIPCVACRGPAPTYNLTPLAVPQNSAEILVHALDKNSVDILSISCNIVGTGVLIFRIYDGTYTSGSPDYVEMEIGAGSTSTLVMFDKHPIRGPGKITVRREADGEAKDSFVTAVYMRGGA